MKEKDIQIELAVQKEFTHNLDDKPDLDRNENVSKFFRFFYGIDPSKFILPGAILVAAILVSGSIIFYGLNSGSNRTALVKESVVDVSVDDDPVLGDPKAKITLIEFSDFQCPFCRAFWSGAFQQIKSEYIDTGKARLIYRDFPLSFHPGAMPAAEGAECADDQGKFWEMHDKIFEEQAKFGSGTIQFSENDVRKWAGQITGLDMSEWSECFDSNKHASEINKDIADGNLYGVSGTPTVFVNGKPIVGALPFSAFKAEIDKLIK
ncbi:MAG: hypothetical protein COV30_02285 [Candidatus Yanofskybacteria bacterium CG10_big_fil_rev_8_21_14_0_10_37_15]|uniref:Thioredoxin domain-containing protein n=1 Tax=Candidatus Yanofskybacteria bacterium CG10_big_fil_rev_8_21_14_0_10_37_15 TaxID=1975097 RepID=A0A2H0R7A7_9BACT|nr:MAG: hypothetical protein COV30_02285 [Candidatus Yanofskybacteria bacterium CG10_big_fil_rev_8_21_14_0_10_37_15]